MLSNINPHSYFCSHQLVDVFFGLELHIARFQSKKQSKSTSNSSHLPCWHTATADFDPKAPALPSISATTESSLRGQPERQSHWARSRRILRLWISHGPVSAQWVSQSDSSCFPRRETTPPPPTARFMILHPEDCTFNLDVLVFFNAKTDDLISYGLVRRDQRVDAGQIQR